MAILKFQHDRAGDTSALTFEIAADGSHGAIGPLGISPRVGFARGVIDADGWARAVTGGDYILNDAQFEGAEYRLTVRRGSAPISTVHFVPLAKNGVVDVNALTSADRPQPVFPEEVRSISAIAADAEAAAAEARAQGQELAQVMADTAQVGAEARAMGAEALQRVGTKTYRYDSEREADSSQPEGADSYTLESRTNHTRTGGKWVLVGAAVAGADEVAATAQRLGAMSSYAGRPAPIGVAGMSERNPDMADYLGTFRTLLAEPFGIGSNAVAHLVGVGRKPTDRLGVMGIGSHDDLSTFYDGRDSVALALEITGRTANRSTAAQTTYTATGATCPGIDWSRVRPEFRRGAIVDTVGGAMTKWSGILVDFDPQAQTITVDKWTRRTGAPAVNGRFPIETGTPANGTALIINPETYVFGMNPGAILQSDSQANHAVGIEVNAWNYKKDYNPADPADERVEVNLINMYPGLGGGFSLFRGINLAGDVWDGMSVEGARHAGYRVGRGAHNPDQAFEDASDSTVSYRLAGKHTHGIYDTATHSSTAVNLEGRAAVGVAVRGDSYDISYYAKKADGRAFLLDGTNTPRLFELSAVGDKGVIMHLGGSGANVRSVEGAGVVRVQYDGGDGLLLHEGEIRTKRLAVGDTATATTAGTIKAKLPIRNFNGELIGYMPIYDQIN